MIKNGNITERRTVDLDGLTLEAVADVLAEASEGLAYVRLNVERDYEYGGTVVRQYVSGLRPATPAEVAYEESQRNRAINKERERQDRLAEHLRQIRPDLFA